MFSIIHTGPRVDGGQYRGDWILHLIGRLLDFKDNLFAGPPRPQLFISSVQTNERLPT